MVLICRVVEFTRSQLPDIKLILKINNQLYFIFQKKYKLFIVYLINFFLFLLFNIQFYRFLLFKLHVILYINRINRIIEIYYSCLDDF